MTSERERYRRRLATILGKIDLLISDFAGSDTMPESERKILRQAFNEIAPVEAKVYREVYTG